MHYPFIAFDRKREADQISTRRRVLFLSAGWFVGMLVIWLAAAAARNGLIGSTALLVTLFAIGWSIAGVSAAAAAFTVSRRWSNLPASTKLLGLAPWAAICLVATLVLRNFLV